MSSQKALIDKYILVLLEYIHLIDTSEIIRGLDNSTTVFQIGLHAIAHIYKLTYYITKNVETAGCYTQKGVYCYLEYIEQMNRPNSLHNLNNMDAVLFVYDKTLAEIYTPSGKRTNTSHEQNMFTNIVSLNHPETREHNWKVILENLSIITQTVLWIDNTDITYLERLNLTHEYLPKYLNIYADVSGTGTGSSKDNIEIVKYISHIQDKLKFTLLEYVEFIDVFYKTYKKIAKHARPTSTALTDDKCLFITVNLSGKTMSEVLASECGKQEGWKTVADFVKWLF